MQRSVDRISVKSVSNPNSLWLVCELQLWFCHSEALINTACYPFEYLEIFNKIPVSVINTISEVPPALINGRGTPVLGMVFVITETLIIV